MADDLANFDAEIERLLQAIAEQPADLASHRKLRTIALQRKAAGGSDLGIIEKTKLKLIRQDPIAALLQAERLMCYDPDHAPNLVQMHRHADRAGLDGVAAWIRELIDRTS